MRAGPRRARPLFGVLDGGDGFRGGGGAALLPAPALLAGLAAAGLPAGLTAAGVRLTARFRLVGAVAAALVGLITLTAHRSSSFGSGAALRRGDFESVPARFDCRA